MINSLLSQYESMQQSKTHGVLPNLELISKLIQKFRSQNTPLLKEEEQSSLEELLSKLKPNDSSYPQPETEELNVSEVLSELKLEELEDEKIFKKASLNINTELNDHDRGFMLEEPEYVPIVQSVEMLDLPIDGNEKLKLSMGSNEDISDTVVVDIDKEIEYLTKRSV